MSFIQFLKSRNVLKWRLQNIYISDEGIRNRSNLLDRAKVYTTYFIKGIQNGY